jgi:hypothetical protein
MLWTNVKSRLGFLSSALRRTRLSFIGHFSRTSYFHLGHTGSHELKSVFLQGYARVNFYLFVTTSVSRFFRSRPRRFFMSCPRRLRRGERRSVFLPRSCRASRPAASWTSRLLTRRFWSCLARGGGCYQG